MGSQAEFLMNHDDAGLFGRNQCGGCRRTVERYPSRARRHQTCRDAHQRGFSRAVLADECHHLPFVHIKVDALKHRDASKRLGNLLE